MNLKNINTVHYKGGTGKIQDYHIFWLVTKTSKMTMMMTMAAATMQNNNMEDEKQHLPPHPWNYEPSIHPNCGGFCVYCTWHV